MQSNNIIERTKAREDLIKGNIKLALRFLLRIMLSYDEVTNLDDLINEVNVDLIKAVNFYSPEMGPLKNLLYFTIKRSISQCLESGSRNMEVPSNYNKIVNEISDGILRKDEIISKNKIDFKTYEALRLALIEDEFDYTDSSLIEPAFDDLILADKEGLKVKIDSMLKMLEPVEEEIIRYRFGIDCDHKTMDELAKMYNLTKERVRMIEARALRKLRSPLRSSEVRRSM